jgi:hypothetical protein
VPVPSPGIPSRPPASELPAPPILEPPTVDFKSARAKPRSAPPAPKARGRGRAIADPHASDTARRPVGSGGSARRRRSQGRPLLTVGLVLFIALVVLVGAGLVVARLVVH